MLGYMHNNQTLTLQDYLDFIKRARWKEYTQHRQYKRCGKYLDGLDRYYSV